MTEGPLELDKEDREGHLAHKAKLGQAPQAPLVLRGPVALPAARALQGSEGHLAPLVTVTLLSVLVSLTTDKDTEVQRSKLSLNHL